MSTETPWSVRGVEPETREAAKMAARRSGLTLGHWLNRTIRNAVAEELGSGQDRPADEAQLPALPNAVLLAAIQEQLDAQRVAIEATLQQERATADKPAVEATRLHEIPEPAIDPDPRLQAEFDEIKLLIHDYLGLLLPVAEPVQALSRQLEDMSNLAKDVRRSADAAERAAASVLPLERAVLRMTGAASDDPVPVHERRGSGLGKLFGN